MNDTIDTPTTSLKRKHQITSVAVVAALVTLLLFLLLLRGCEDTPQNAPDYLLTPRDLAAQHDVAGILKYCHEEIRIANYRGFARGAYGTIWAGEANEWDCAALAVAALEAEGQQARIITVEGAVRVAYRDGSGESWNVVDLQQPAQHQTVAALPDQSKADLPADQTLAVTLVLNRNGDDSELLKSEAFPLREWVSKPAVIKTVGEGDQLSLELTLGADTLWRSQALQGIERAALKFSWDSGQETERIWTRDLFDRRASAEEIAGHDAPRPDDLYALVVSSGPLRQEVLETRKAMLEEDSDYTPLADKEAQLLVLMGVKYQVDSDLHTALIAEKTGVEVEWRTPRITIAARESYPQPGPGNEKTLKTTHSLDVLSDEVEAEGERSREFHVARGLANDLIETRVIFDRSETPVISASTVFSRLHGSGRDAIDHRITLIEREAQRIMVDEPIGTRVSLKARPPVGLRYASGLKNQRPEEPSSVIMERVQSGLRLHGVKQIEAASGEPDEPRRVRQAYEWSPDSFTDFQADANTLAVVADALLSRNVKVTQTRMEFRPNYRLEFDVESGWPSQSPRWMRGSHLIYRLESGGESQRLAVVVDQENGRPTGSWVRLDETISASGTIEGAWPDVLEHEDEEFALGTFLAPPGKIANATSTKFSVHVGSRELTFSARELAVPHPQVTPVEIEENGDWYAGVVRKKRGSQFLIHYFGYDDSYDVLVSQDRVREMHPVEVNLNGVWTAANLLERDGDDYRVHVCGKSEDDILVVDESQIREAELIEVLSDGSWYLSSLLRKEGADYHIHYSGYGDGDDETVPAERVRFLNEENPPPLATAVVSNSPRYPLILNWKQGERELTLESVSPILWGRILDQRDSAQSSEDSQSHPATIPHADLQWLGTGLTASAAADGSYAVPVTTPLLQRILIVLDNSGSMRWGAEDEEDAPQGQRRIDDVRTAVRELLERIPEPIEVSLWSFSGGTDTLCDYTSDRALLHKTLEKNYRTYSRNYGGTQIATAVGAILDHLEAMPLYRDTLVILLTDGDSTQDQLSGDVYRDRGATIPIHTIGFAIRSESKAEKELRDLAAVSGGSFHLAEKKEALQLVFQRFTSDLEEVRLEVRSDCTSASQVTVEYDEIETEARDIPLTTGCDCVCRGTDLLTITDQNVDQLSLCQDLSPKAAEMIKTRVEGGRWSVSIPNRRVVVGNVTAYGWFEIDSETGRIVGRTEDGLHGTSGGGGFPPVTIMTRRGGFIAWYHGIVAYTVGSVDAALKWNQSPGFLHGTAEDFSRFVQANALQFVVNWWNSVGSGSFGQDADQFWAGVCLNFALQSHALGLPSAACARRWAEDLCNRMADALAAKGEEWAQDKLREFLDGQFGAEFSELLSTVDELGDDDLLDQLREMWKNAHREALQCSRIGGP